MPTKKNLVQPRVAPKPRPAGTDIPVTAATPGNQDDLASLFPARKDLGVPIAEKKSRTRSRQWDYENLYGKGYSVYGVRADLRKWIEETAKRLGVRSGEVAEFAIDYSVQLLKSAELKIVTHLNPRGRRHTLYPVMDEKKTRREKKVIVTWWPFGKDLKEWIGKASEANDVAQGELVTFLLERAREDYEKGLLKFKFEKGSSDRIEFKLPE